MEKILVRTFREVPLETLLGKTFDWVESSDRGILFHNEKEMYWLTHRQECCEEVYLESVDTDLSLLVNEKITIAEVTTEENEDKNELWTFYRFGTKKGICVARFLSDTDTCYSVEVDLYKIDISNEIFSEDLVYKPSPNAHVHLERFNCNFEFSPNEPIRNFFSRVTENGFYISTEERKKFEERMKGI